MSFHRYFGFSCLLTFRFDLDHCPFGKECHAEQGYSHRTSKNTDGSQDGIQLQENGPSTTFNRDDDECGEGVLFYVMDDGIEHRLCVSYGAPPRYLMSLTDILRNVYSRTNQAR